MVGCTFQTVDLNDALHTKLATHVGTHPPPTAASNGDCPDEWTKFTTLFLALSVSILLLSLDLLFLGGLQRWSEKVSVVRLGAWRAQYHSVRTKAIEWKTPTQAHKYRYEPVEADLREDQPNAENASTGNNVVSYLRKNVDTEAASRSRFPHNTNL